MPRSSTTKKTGCERVVAFAVGFAFTVIGNADALAAFI
jgi:hypothetical protein